MTDAQFLTWIRDRIVYVYGESPNVDFVLRLGEILKNDHRNAGTCCA
jgi:hypothetical protein